MGAIILRRPELEDVPQLADLHVRAWRETYAGLMPEAFLAGLLVEDRASLWRRSIADPELILSAACDGETPIGFAIAGPWRKSGEAPRDASPAPAGRGEIYAIYVLAKEQRRGAGRGLMAEMARGWCTQGGRSLALWVVSENAKARRFYEALGGQAEGTTMFRGPGFDLEETGYVFEDLARITG